MINDHNENTKRWVNSGHRDEGIEEKVSKANEKISNESWKLKQFEYSTKKPEIFRIKRWNVVK